MDYPEKIRLAIQYMEEHSSEKILLEEIAKASFISPFHFHRIFKSITNSTPREYIERIRIERAAHLFIDMDKSMELYLKNLQNALGENNESAK